MPRVDVLSRLFAPRTVAVLGASGREGRPGYQVVRALHRLGGPDIFPVTPRYDEVAGIPAVSDLGALDEPADLVVIASGPGRIEEEAQAAIEHGARSLVIFGGVPSAQDPQWLSRITALARDADVPMLGPDSLGFVDYTSSTAATWSLPAVEPGGIALISQSGTVFWEANTNDPRMRFSFTGHTGMEGSITIADLVAHAVSLPETNVVGLYVETIRDPDGFVEALELAADRDVPVVALFAGRTTRSRDQMSTHAGRLAGDRAAFEALFRRHGVACTDTADEFWTTLSLLGAPTRAQDGGLAAIMDSGGGVALFLDYAEELGVPLASLTPESREQLGELLGAEDVSNPVDFWAGAADLGGHTREILDVLAADRSTALVLAFTTYGEPQEAGFAASVARACGEVAGTPGAPVVAATYSSRQLHSGLMADLAQQGVPTLDGMRTAMLAVRHAFAYRDFSAAAPAVRAESFGDDVLERWRSAIDEHGELSEADALEVLETAGIPVVAVRRATSGQEAIDHAADLGFPVVLKTDEGVAHKAAQGGVKLGLVDATAVERAYQDVAATLGPRVILAPMLSGAEVALGIVAGQFGPMLMVATGGTAIEVLQDRRYLLAPATADDVGRALEELQVGAVLGSRFGLDSPGVQQLCRLASRLSWLACALEDAVTEIDINPVLVTAEGCVAVDALVAGAQLAQERNHVTAPGGDA